MKPPRRPPRRELLFVNLMMRGKTKKMVLHHRKSAIIKAEKYLIFWRMKVDSSSGRL